MKIILTIVLYMFLQRILHNLASCKITTVYKIKQVKRIKKKYYIQNFHTFRKNIIIKPKRKVNYVFFSNKPTDIKMNINDSENIEKQIEKISQEISLLIERNESIKIINDDPDIKKEYENNQNLLKEKKKTLNELCSIFSQPLNLVENRSKLESLIKRRLFYTNSFEIYGGVSGLIDYGPSGCLLKYELEKLWRNHFVFYDEMLEIKGTCITPYSVLKTSGHVDRFTDLMIKDIVTKDCYRADKYLSEWLKNKLDEIKDQKNDGNEKREKNFDNSENINNVQTIQEIESILRRLDGMNENEIKDVIKKYNIKSPEKNDLSDPFPFNLMFQTKIGPKENNENDTIEKNINDMNKNNIAFLRPETAQGIFVNFKKLLEYNGGKMPFAGAQIGLGFRNEISPRNGLLRVREFEMGEIEYFFNPEKSKHEKYDLYKHLVLPLYPRTNQLNDNGNVITNMSLEEAVNNGIICNEALAYFLARTYLFLLKCGIKKDGIRYRQHLEKEMAHYANDCWDAEILTSYGYIECVGHADRSAYDLKHHMNATGSNLYGCQKYDKPVDVEFVKIIPNKAKIGMKFKSDQNKIYKILNEKTNEDLLIIEQELNKNQTYILKGYSDQSNDNNNDSFELTRDMISFQKYTKKVQESNFIPNVIEPSFGIGRLIFCILEHSFRVRQFTDDKEERHYLSLPYALSPIKCSVLSISNNKEFYPYIKQIQTILSENNISCKLDNSSVSIGKKYARIDEIGIPFAVTIDFQTLKDKTITLRDRDSMLQIRVNISEVSDIINSLLSQKSSWSDYVQKYGLFIQQNLEN
ncbi:glycine--tRNA ligase, putative [Plasmodium yoelii]|nr:glycine--tRNA ligase, putative [Plasmodium yoelii]CDU85082.1 glycine--tRNA ligase, putative [Plasmodium yoelii]VTZ78977.1 glycine--tRNA ligase, putative [Plasmodium yoelii]|eukprot:XP_728923.2 glycine--tRNA ligase, putative [Plasmodium yoelii]